MMSAIDKAFYRLKGYCDKRVGCEGCRFSSENGCVLTYNLPVDWEIPSKKESNDE